MLPKPHIILGAIFTLILLIFFPTIEWYYLFIFFVSSFLIDFDHYMCAVWKTKKLSLSKAVKYYLKLEKIDMRESKKGIFRKSDFHIFHTVEFHFLILILGLMLVPFLYILLGMVFHSVADFIYLVHKKKLYRREFFLVNYIRRKLINH